MSKDKKITGSFVPTSIVSQTADKVSLMVELNGKPEQLTEIDFEVLGRTNASLSMDKTVPVKLLAKFRDQHAQVQREIEEMKSQAKKAKKEEKDKLLENIEKATKILGVLEEKAAQQESAIQDIDEQISENAAWAGNRPAFIKYQLQKIADEDLARTAKEEESFEEVKIKNGQIVL